MSLLVSDLPASTVFDLLGRDENSATYAFGWTLEKSRNLIRRLLADLANIKVDETDDIEIELQRSGDDRGYTDIEILIPKKCHLIIEAKVGVKLPGRQQLARYRRRLKNQKSTVCRFISISAASKEYATQILKKKVRGVEVDHRSWADIRRLVQLALREASQGEERHWLRELASHLREYEFMDRTTDNSVYVVALSLDRFLGCPSTGVEIVERDKRYFYPVGGGWPSAPPNYVGFRYKGQLQAIHHIEKWKIVSNLHDENPKWPRLNRKYFVFELGQAMKPSTRVKTGDVRYARRVWCAIDTLLSGKCKTISAAESETKRRLRIASNLQG